MSEVGSDSIQSSVAESLQRELATMGSSMAEVPEVFQEVILSKIHHTMDGIESLGAQCSEILNSQFFVGEKILLSVPLKKDQQFSGVISAVDKTQKLADTNESSPNSDKENDCTMKPYHYSVTVHMPNSDVEKTIKQVPSKDIRRVRAPPSARDIREFIERSASRPRSYWVVGQTLRDKFNIKDKVSPVFASPSPSLTTSAKKTTPPMGKADLSPSGSNSLHPVTPSTSGAGHASHNGVASSDAKDKGLSWKKEASGDKKSVPKVIDISSSSSSSSESSDSDNEGEKAPVVRRSLGLPPSAKAATKVIKSKQKEAESEKKRQEKEAERRRKEREVERKRKQREAEKRLRDEERQRAQMAAFLRKSTSVVDLTGSDDEGSRPLAALVGYHAIPAHTANAASRKKAMALLQKRGSLDSKPKLVKGPSSGGFVKKSTSFGGKGPSGLNKTSGDGKKKDGHESDSSDDLVPLAKVASTSKTPTKIQKARKSIPASPKMKPLTPAQLQQMRANATISQLERAFKLGPRGRRFQTEVVIAARILNTNHVDSIPNPDIRQAVRDKQERDAEQKMLEKMTPEEREEYIKKKKEAVKKRIAERKRMTLLQAKKRYEESTLADLKPLPEVEPVRTPPSVPNECFGDVAMVTEFFSAYSEFLNSKDAIVTSSGLMHALDLGNEGFGYVAQLLIPLLQTLLQDEVAKDYRFLNVGLGKLDVTHQNAGEIVRLCLRPRDPDNDSETQLEEEEEGDDSFQSVTVDETILRELDEKEFFDLKPKDQLTLLVALIHRLLDSYGVNEFQEQTQQEATKLWKEKMGVLHEKNVEREAEKAKVKEKQRQEAEQKEKDKVKGGILESFGVKVEDNKGTETEEGGKGKESLDSELSRQSRKVTRQMREEEERREKERRKAEAEQEEKVKRWEQTEKKCEAGLKAAKRVVRLSALGADRDHRRYWVFSKQTPGIFLELGWVLDYIDYQAEAPPPLPAEAEKNDESMDTSENPNTTDSRAPHTFHQSPNSV